MWAWMTFALSANNCGNSFRKFPFTTIDLSYTFYDVRSAIECGGLCVLQLDISCNTFGYSETKELCYISNTTLTLGDNCPQCKKDNSLTIYQGRDK